MSNRPVVVVIENPEADPSVHVAGDVEVIEVSSYPASGFNTEPGDYGDYPDEMRALSARLQQLGNETAAAEVAGLAVAFEQRWGSRSAD